MVYSASAVYAYERFADSAHFLKRHLLALFIGFIGAVGAMLIDPEVLRRRAKTILFLSLLSLILVLVPGIGRETGGARRWFWLGVLSFQPAEFAKLALIIYLASTLARKEKILSSFLQGFLPLIIVAGSIILLIIIQPDLGSAINIGLITLLVFLVSGIRLSHLSLLVASSLGVFGWLIYNFPYRRRRIISFLNPWLDARGSGFQIIQSFLALGSGGLFGVGLGQSRQKLFYLPQSHTDFIFSIIGEELGFVGAVSVLILFSLLIWQGIKVALRSTNQFNQLLSFGITVMIGLEALINIAVASGSIPTKGLPLPFISYGGSSLVFKMVSVGILLNLARDKYTE